MCVCVCVCIYICIYIYIYIYICVYVCVYIICIFVCMPAKIFTWDSEENGGGGWSSLKVGTIDQSESRVGDAVGSRKR